MVDPATWEHSQVRNDQVSSIGLSSLKEFMDNQGSFDSTVTIVHILSNVLTGIFNIEFQIFPYQLETRSWYLPIWSRFSKLQHMLTMPPYLHPKNIRMKAHSLKLSLKVSPRK
jgi:hypothetical protein